MTEDDQRIVDLLLQIITRLDELNDLEKRVSKLEGDRSRKYAALVASAGGLAPILEGIIRHHFHL